MEDSSEEKPNKTKTNPSQLNQKHKRKRTPQALPSNTSKIPHLTSPHPNTSAGLFGRGSKTLACSPPYILLSSSKLRSSTLGRCRTIIIWRRRAIEEREKVLESDMLLKREFGEKSAEQEEVALWDEGGRGWERGEVVLVECGRRVGEVEGEVKAVRRRWRVRVVVWVSWEASMGWKRLCRILMCVRMCVWKGCCGRVLLGAGCNKRRVSYRYDRYGRSSFEGTIAAVS